MTFATILTTTPLALALTGYTNPHHAPPPITEELVAPTTDQI